MPKISELTELTQISDDDVLVINALVNGVNTTLKIKKSVLVNGLAKQVDLDSTNVSVANANTEIENSKNRINALETSQGETDIEVADIKANLEITNAKVTDLENGLRTTNGKVATLENGLNATNGRVIALEQGLENANGQILSLETEVNNTKSALETTNTNLSLAEDRITALENESSNLGFEMKNGILYVNYMKGE